jgi:oligopeptidase B
MGGSAGGMLMGVAINERPSCFTGVAQVPFVDVVTTMLDESIPLTTGEFEEWGNPQDEEYYRYMKSYSPTMASRRRPIPTCWLPPVCTIPRCNTGNRQNGWRSCAS